MGCLQQLHVPHRGCSGLLRDKSLWQINPRALPSSNLSVSSSQRYMCGPCEVMTAAHDLWIFPEFTSAAMAQGPMLWAPGPWRCLASSKYQHLFLPCNQEGHQIAGGEVLPFLEGWHTLLFVTFGCLSLMLLLSGADFLYTEFVQVSCLWSARFPTQGEPRKAGINSWHTPLTGRWLLCWSWQGNFLSWHPPMPESCCLHFWNLE